MGTSLLHQKIACFSIVMLVCFTFVSSQDNASDQTDVHDSDSITVDGRTSSIDQEDTSSYPETAVHGEYEITVVGIEKSLTSPVLIDAADLKTRIPGGFTLKKTDCRGTCNFKELQKLVPGVYTQSDGGTEESRVSIRGSGIQSEYEPIGVEFLLDGIPYNEGNGAVNLEDFDLNSIIYSETYRGANGFRYGSSTLGGAMNLVSFTGYTAVPFSLAVETGTYGTTDANASIANVNGSHDFYLSGTARYRNGGRQHSRENIERFFGNIGYRFNSTAENRVYLTVVNFKRQIPGELTPDEIEDNPLQANPEFVDQNIGRGYRAVRIADKFTIQKGNRRFDAGLVWRYGLRNDTSFYSEESRAGINRTGSNNLALILNFVNNTEILGSRNIVTLGGGGNGEFMEGVHYKNIHGQRGDSTAVYEIMAENIPLYAEMQQYIGKKVSVIAGIQTIYAGRQFESEFGEEEEEEEGEEDDAELNFFGVNPKLGLIFEAGDAVQFFANGSKSWQPPSFEHLLGLGEEEDEEGEEEEDSASSVRFTKLKAQYAWSIEGGCRGELGSIGWELSAYRSWVSNELLSINDIHGNVIGTENIPHSIHQGIEAGLAVDILGLFSAGRRNANGNNRLMLNQCYTWNDFHFDNDPVYRYNKLGGIPQNIYHGELKFETAPGFYIGPEAESILSPYPADQANTLDADPYAVFNLSMGYDCKKGLSGYVKIRNAFDKHYIVGLEPTPNIRTGDEGEAVFEPGLGRSFHCGLQYRW